MKLVYSEEAKQRESPESNCALTLQRDLLEFIGAQFRAGHCKAQF